MLCHRSELNGTKVGVLWANWGPYHYSRFDALSKLHGDGLCLGIAMSGQGSPYEKRPVGSTSNSLKVLNTSPCFDQLSASCVFRQIYGLVKNYGIEVMLLPSYWPRACCASLVASKLAGARCVMMNESHALTERSRGLRKFAKKCLLKLFDSALVGGTAQQAHFASLGMNSETIFSGYDAVDNNYFTASSKIAKSTDYMTRKRLGLPSKYILNLGRMIEKKNLSTLLNAYQEMASVSSFEHALVLVGGGDKEPELRCIANQLGLKVRDLVSNTVPQSADRTVFFGGYRGIKENPAIYGLADVFVLPSTVEEWGLVINEAMACGLPIVASKCAGATFDLVVDGINGFKFEPLNYLELAKMVATVLEDDKLRQKMGAESLRIVSNWGCERFAANALNAVSVAKTRFSRQKV